MIIPVTDSVLDRAEDLWAIARRGGRPFGDADLIIAATALETGRVLVTGKTAHYAGISVNGHRRRQIGHQLWPVS